MKLKNRHYGLLTSLLILIGCGNVETSNNNLNEESAPLAVLINIEEISKESSSSKVAIDEDISLNYKVTSKIPQEDAEDGSTDKWRIYDKSPSDASISNIYNEAKESNVILFKGTGLQNGFLLSSWSTEEVTADSTIIQWSMNYSEEFMVYVKVSTTDGYRYIYYDDSDYSYGVVGYDEPHYIHHGLGADSHNGTWKTFTRDINADLQRFQPNNKLISIHGFFIRGSGMVDDIGLITPQFHTSLLSTYIAETNIRNITLSKNEKKVFVANASKGLQIIDVSNPKNPILIGNYPLPNDFVRDIELSEDETKAFLTVTNKKASDTPRGLLIFDISNPTAIKLLSNYTGTDQANNITLSNDGTKAFIADGWNGLKIIDIGDIDSPQLLGTYNTNDSAINDVALSNDGTKAFVTKNENKGLDILDVSDPYNPILIGNYPIGYFGNISLSKDGTKVFITSRIISTGFTIIDISNPSEPILLSNYSNNSYIQNIKLSNDETKVFVVDYDKGLQIIDINDLSSPTLLHTDYTGRSSYDIALSQDNSKAFITNGTSLRIIQIDRIDSDENHIQEVIIPTNTN